jgi:hypothetical protein
MQLPQANIAVATQEKVIQYLLNAEHPDGSSKARFFHSLGFCAAEWQKLADAIRNLAVKHPVTSSVESAHGRKYIIDGRIESPSGDVAAVRTVWIVDKGCDIPRLVTAFPSKR